ncbi:DUF4129 domain-containing protein [Aeoliella sp. ICT_H6.2]|uniref:DUF4129 domain-containing protein n=1 Tax=Aeoliella straminimaris TaxID=2954799 RepID=A0A9X2FEW3_9BACT|nr:DUF4129 domain-containing protein [Aeoliella straminimaris]MCO6045004.1 DUF4129 domain-containing protein [Aeoliella straminimaris]
MSVAYMSRFRSNYRCMAVALAVLTWCAMLPPAFAESDFSDANTAIESGKNSLSSAPKIPWYDSETDDFRAAKVEVPKPPRNNRSNFDGYDVLLGLGWLLLAVLLGLLIYLIVRSFLRREVEESIVASVAHAGADIARVEELPVALNKSPADFLDEAQRLYSKGDFAQAIVYLFSHQLLQLDRRHWIRLVKGKTNRQYLREVRRSASPSAGTLADTFYQTVLVFEEVFFGKRLPPRETIEGVWQKIDLFESLVGAREEQAA